MAYQCNVCKLHYKSKKLADECYDWCSKYNGCNLDVTRDSLERRGEYNSN
ncbi:MAG: hypothetical protein KGH64_03515 [Candidatus Micrarchaeota archaeon]|nr:hypothetical protein [Candidatus Micrarchaeota archaeon]MDE1834378.1 hypothetical protein [Candidatus Micrarchaeota archaeon]